jgi:hypothetical protein
MFIDDAMLRQRLADMNIQDGTTGKKMYIKCMILVYGDYM